MDNTNGWSQWSKYILKELERQGKCINSIKTDINKIRVEIAMIKVKSSLFGILAGAVPAIIMLIVWLVKGG